MDFKNLYWIIYFLTILLYKNVHALKKLNSSQAFDENWNNASDLENELEQKRTKNTAGATLSLNGQWSGWSEWSTCSRSCDGGIIQQIRRCSNSNGCRGESVRHRICNMQPCPEQQDFRAQQCSAYNDVPYDGTLYKWTPHYDYVDPCALTCRGRPAHLSDDEFYNTDSDSEHYDEQNVVVQLSARVQDGTRCRTGSLDMCIQGKCQRIGCDLKIGSTKKIDACGLCGGDGSLCSQAIYYWEIAPMSPCSVVCGGGYKMSKPICKSRVNGGIVDDTFCNAASRPEPPVELCNTDPCPPRWITDEWSSCTRLCGTGYRERMVICAEENNGIRIRVAEILCGFPKPSTQESCIVVECPKWEVEEWTECSVTCDHGIQLRSVECKSNDGSLSAKCDPLLKPLAVRQCYSGISCENDNSNVGKIIIGKSRHDVDLLDHNINTSEFENEGDDDEVDQTSRASDDEIEAVSYIESPPFYLQQSINVLHQEEPVSLDLKDISSTKISNANTNLASSEPMFVKDSDWSPCSVTCGEGIRRRHFRCKIFLEYSKTIATVNDSLCEGEKPLDEVERCVEDPCMLPYHGFDDQYPRDAIKVGVSEPGKTYIWREQGYTSCSASCLGGVEELIINCVREDNGRVVSPFLCSPETKPEARVRTCNDRPCPPRWNYSDYTPCSKSCGIGIKTREVQCIHEVTRGGENTMVVPNSMCPQPPPADRQYCNVLDCPVRWEVGEWSKCSHNCGYGIKERKVECKQIMAQEHKIERPETMCPSVKPPDKKPCNVKSCPPEDPKPVISISNTTHIQHDPKKSRITLKVGGAGIVFFGTQVKIKCPVKRFNRTKIKWSKDHKPLSRSRKFKVSKKGALRILDITFQDAGIYSCHAGLSSAEIHIEVKAKPGQPPVEEFGIQESERLVRERTGSELLISADMTAIEPYNSTHTTIRKKQQSGRERNRRPKSDILLKSEISLNQEENIHDKILHSESASSGGSRTHVLFAIPYLQMIFNNWQYFWPVFKYRSSIEGRLLPEKMEQFDKKNPLTHEMINTSFKIQKEFENKLATFLEIEETHNDALKSRWKRKLKLNRIKTELIFLKYWLKSQFKKCYHPCSNGIKLVHFGIKNQKINCIKQLTTQTNGNTYSSTHMNTHKEILDIENYEKFVFEMQKKIKLFRNTKSAQSNLTLWLKAVCDAGYKHNFMGNSCHGKANKKLCKLVFLIENRSECRELVKKIGITCRTNQYVWYENRPAASACKHLAHPLTGGRF